LREWRETTTRIFVTGGAQAWLAAELGQAFGDGDGEGFSAVAAEGVVEVFEAMDEIDDFFS